MRKLLLVGLMMLAGSAWAEWVDFVEGKNIYVLIDPATIRRDDNMRKVWLLHNYKQRNKDGNLSDRVRNEYDCDQERYRFLTLSMHTETMAGGVTTYNNTYSDPSSSLWKDIVPNSMDYDILKFVCSK
jgi:hypothetical protein